MNKPGKLVGCNSGLLWLLYGLLWGIVAYYFGLLGVPGRFFVLSLVDVEALASSGLDFATGGLADRAGKATHIHTSYDRHSLRKAWHVALEDFKKDFTHFIYASTYMYIYIYDHCPHLEFQSTQNHGLYPKMKGVKSHNPRYFGDPVTSYSPYIKPNRP